MPICVYFQQGRCKYGNTCKNRHVLENQRGDANQKESTDLASVIVEDMSNTCIWAPSCYGVDKYGKNNFEGDTSFEEMRIKAYESILANNFALYKEYEKGLFTEGQVRRQNLQAQIQNPNHFSSSQTTQQAHPTQTPLFGQPLTNPLTTMSFGSFATPVVGGEKKSIFGQPSSIFGNTAQTMNTAFSPQQLQTQQSVFGAQSVFGSTPSAPSLFGNTAQPQPQPGSLFSQSNFPSQNTNSIFGKPLIHQQQVSPQYSILGNTPANPTAPTLSIFGSTPQPTGVLLFPQTAQAQAQTTQNTPFSSSSFPSSSTASTISPNPLFSQAQNQSNPFSTNLQNNLQSNLQSNSSNNNNNEWSASEYSFGSIPELPPPEMYR